MRARAERTNTKMKEWLMQQKARNKKKQEREKKKKKIFIYLWGHGVSSPFFDKREGRRKVENGKKIQRPKFDQSASTFTFTSDK